MRVIRPGRSTWRPIATVDAQAVTRLFTALVVTGLTTLSAVVLAPAADAAPCPEVQVVFARGTFEPPGVGITGQAFVDSLRSRLANKAVDVYAVNYPASLDFNRASDGIVDANNKVRDVIGACPNTKLVLGGYSQGAAVVAYLTTDSIPPGFRLPDGISGPMSPDVAKHVSAVSLFGKPSNGFLNTINSNAPPITIGHLYTDKTIDLCVPADPVCFPDGNDGGAHGLYSVNGMTDQAADYAAKKVA